MVRALTDCQRWLSATNTLGGIPLAGNLTIHFNKKSNENLRINFLVRFNRIFLCTFQDCMPTLLQVTVVLNYILSTLSTVLDTIVTFLTFKYNVTFSMLNFVKFQLPEYLVNCKNIGSST